MKDRYALVVLLVCCGSFSSPVKLFPQGREAATQATPSTADKEMVKRGEAAFSRHCQICHLGRPNKTNPFIGRNLRGVLKNAKPEQETAVREAIKKGSDHMPAYEYTLTPAQIDDLMGYLKSYN